MVACDVTGVVLTKFGPVCCVEVMDHQSELVLEIPHTERFVADLTTGLEQCWLPGLSGDDLDLTWRSQSELVDAFSKFSWKRQQT